MTSAAIISAIKRNVDKGLLMSSMLRNNRVK